MRLLLIVPVVLLLAGAGYNQKAETPAAPADWVTANNDWWLGDPLPGESSNVDPGFASVPSGPLPSLESLRTADLTPTFQSGSDIHSLQDLLDRIDTLNGE